MHAPKRILVADDHEVVRAGLIALLRTHPDMIVVGEAETREQAVERHRTLRPDVTLMDLQMPGGGGLRATMEICAHDRNARVIVVTTYSGDVQATRAFEAGAIGYLLKTSLRTELFDAIEAAVDGRRYVCAEVASEIERYSSSPPLTQIEVRLLGCLLEGASDRKIAAVLSISEQNVTFHLNNIFAKLSASDRADAILKASRRGVFEV
jgi:DNA-binding NarL/FixJ family response regulator